MRGYVLLAVLGAAHVQLATAGDHVFEDPKHNNKHLKECTDQSDCSYQRKCVYDSNYDKPSKVCLHKTLLPDVSVRDGLSVVAVFLCCMMAASAGIGGGGLFTPIYILLVGFIIQEATPLSHVTVFGNSIAQLVVNAPLRHPLIEGPGRPLIDYAIPLIMLPPQLGGNALGTLLNPIIPPDILIVLAEILLLYASVRVFQKGIKLYRAEEAERHELLGSESDTESLAKSVNTECGDPYGGVYERKDTLEVNTRPPRLEDLTEDAAAILDEESKFPLKYFLAALVLWMYSAACYLVMDVSGRCSPGYWVAMASMYPVLIFFVYLGYTWIRSQDARREKAKLLPVEGDVHWTHSKLIAAPCAAFGVGLVAGLLGLGGGELMGPLLLELGMLPKIASATSAYMIVWTTSSDIVNYSTTGMLPPGYSTAYCITGFLAALLGRWLAVTLVAKYNKQSLIALALGFVLVLSMVLFAWRAATSDQNNPWWPFGGPCNS
ncbi:hypothetical protein DIPPA_02209 [Diplonema papillatum]|nr:hypothetical protein DIPPA_02209 [Diplonema papillatum]